MIGVFCIINTFTWHWNFKHSNFNRVTSQPEGLRWKARTDGPVLLNKSNCCDLSSNHCPVWHVSNDSPGVPLSQHLFTKCTSTTGKANLTVASKNGLNYRTACCSGLQPDLVSKWVPGYSEPLLEWMIVKFLKITIEAVSLESLFSLVHGWKSAKGCRD